MRVTRRFLTVAATGAFLALAGVILSRPVYLVGAGLIGGWLLAQQYAFLRAFIAAVEDCTVEQTVVPERPRVEESVTAALSVRSPNSDNLHRHVAMQPPVSLTGSDREDRECLLPPGEAATETTATFECPVAGRATFEQPTLRASDAMGLFVATAKAGTPTTVEVIPRQPRDIHIGEGGVQVAAAYGEHTSERRGAGLEPAELREYSPGDSANQIDWNATARLNQPHVLEFEAETDRQTVLLFDHRSSTNVGVAGETAFEYLREVSIMLATAAQRRDDPLGLYAVGDEGVTVATGPDSTPTQYTVIREHLLALDPTRESTTDHQGTHQRRASTGDPGAARETAAQLAGEDSAFATRLAPYFESAATYLRHLESEPLFRTARSYIDRLEGHRWTVLLTTDANPVEVTETVRLLQRGGNQVLVLLAPRVLYEVGGLSDLDDAYEDYVEFEEFRQRLGQLERVTALEVGPGDRIDALLATRRSDRQGSARAGGG
jgi:uncharacterized protein (DUF58 family)